MLGIGKRKLEMYKFRLILLILCLPIISFGQYDSKGDQKSRFRPGFMWYFTGYRPAVKEKVRKYDRLIFDVTYNDWTGDNQPFNNHWASIGLNTNLMFDIPLSKGNTVALGLGIAHELKSIRHNNYLYVDQTQNCTVYQPKDSLANFYKSTFGGNSFSIPVELRFRKESWRHFKFHLGGRVGYQANLYNRYVSKDAGIKTVTKNIGFPDINRLIYGAHVRIGIRNWALFGNYYFSPVFKNNQSVKLNIIQFGVSISLY